MPSYIVVGSYLAGILKQEIIGNAAPDIFSSYENSGAIFDAFREQFALYTRQEHPFNRNTSLPPRDYWIKLSSIKGATVLAVCLLD